MKTNYTKKIKKMSYKNLFSLYTYEELDMSALHSK